MVYLISYLLGLLTFNYFTIAIGRQYFIVTMPKNVRCKIIKFNAQRIRVFNDIVASGNEA